MDFILFSSISWDEQGGAHRPTQLALALAAAGHRVLFVQIPECPAPPRVPAVELTSLAELGLSEWEIARAYYGIENPPLEPIAARLLDRVKQFEREERRAAIWAIPFAPFVRLFSLLSARGYVTVYDCIDNFERAQEMGYYFISLQAEEFLTREADLVTGLSEPIVTRQSGMRPAGQVELLPDGAAPQFKAQGPPPQDLLRGDVTLGFWGTIADYMVDVDALAHVARSRPRWAINLIGRCDDEPSRPSVAAALRGLPNVRLLGPRPHDTLGRYLAGFDVCLVPFPDSAFSRGRDPIKVYEYLAGYKPIVALHTPQLAALPYTRVADSPDAFIQEIEQACQTPLERAVVDAFLRKNSWAARAERLTTLLSATQPGARPAAAGLLPNFPDSATNDAARLKAYIARLEKTAEERRAFGRRLEEQAGRMDRYVKKLEATHPLIGIKRLVERVRSRAHR